MSSPRTMAEALASAFLAGDWHLRPMLARGLAAVPRAGRWLPAVAFEARQRWPEPPLHQADALVAFLAAHPALARAARRRDLAVDAALPHAPVRRWLPFAPRMGPSPWPVRALDTEAELAAWLGLDGAMLRWLADTRGWAAGGHRPKLQHYRCTWVDRGARLPRLLEAPKQRLKAAQRKVLEEVLSPVPAHPAAHGFVRGRSVRTHAALHAGKALVVRFDLEAFFTWLQPARALGLFRALGYPRRVATLLLGLCTTRTPPGVLAAAPLPRPLTPAVGARLAALRARLRGRHLAQGAPTSPALANLTCFWLDVRLAGLAEALGATYSRYADDLTFSGPATLPVGTLAAAVATICREEGLRVDPRKTRVQRARRRQAVTGLVVNRWPAVPRPEREALEAELYNLARGRRREPREPAGQLRSRLEGRVAWVAHAHPAHAAYLKELLARVDWGAW